MTNETYVVHRALSSSRLSHTSLSSAKPPSSLDKKSRPQYCFSPKGKTGRLVFWLLYLCFLLFAVLECLPHSCLFWSLHYLLAERSMHKTAAPRMPEPGASATHEGVELTVRGSHSWSPLTAECAAWGGGETPVTGVCKPRRDGSSKYCTGSG